MAEYIDREALIRYIEKQEVIIKDGLSIADAMRIQGNVFRRCVETFPAADVVSVVRCRDCKYRSIKAPIPARYCEVWKSYVGHGDDGYCCYGEMKEQ